MAAGSRTSRRTLMQAGIGAILALPAAWRRASGAVIETSAKLHISNRISPRNRRRPLRPHTLYIVLHTTEGAQTGSLDKVWRLGEAHYFVAADGSVFRIVDRARIATHAGRSMWEGHRNIDNYSIGIEVVGFHDREISSAQYSALRQLLAELKSLYHIPDRGVLTHSMVAYGRPNRFHSGDHRGRKRCGMIFARPEVRTRLGLAAKATRDSDVEAGRLIVADAQLYRFLFARPAATPSDAVSDQKPVPIPPESNIVTRESTPWYIAREQYASPSTTYVFPDGRRLRGNQISDWSRIPEGTRVLVAEGDAQEEQPMEGFREIGVDGDTARALAGDAFDQATTIYFFPDGLIRTGSELSSGRSTRTLLDRLPCGTRVLVGYVYGGYVKTRRLPSSIAGIMWNYPSTFYRFPDGRIVSGDGIHDAAIPPRTLIFYQN